MSTFHRGARFLTNQGFNKTPAYLLLHSADGTAYYLFVEDDGTLKVHTSKPTANSDGSAIGDQSD